MFPCCVDILGIVSTHVETIVVLSKGIDISAGKVQVEFSVEDMDLSAAHGNASYNKIKKHVYEKTGLQVSNLNIAQVKRKYGTIERENYNLPKPRIPSNLIARQKRRRRLLLHFSTLR